MVGGLFPSEIGDESLSSLNPGTRLAVRLFAASRYFGTPNLVMVTYNSKWYLFFYLAVECPTPPRQRRPDVAHHEPDKKKKTRGQKYTRMKRNFESPIQPASTYSSNQELRFGACDPSSPPLLVYVDRQCVTSHPSNRYTTKIASRIPTHSPVFPSLYPYCASTPFPSILHCEANGVSYMQWHPSPQL